MKAVAQLLGGTLSHLRSTRRLTTTTSRSPSVRPTLRRRLHVVIALLLRAETRSHSTQHSVARGALEVRAEPRGGSLGNPAKARGAHCCLLAGVRGRAPVRLGLA